ncbi:MAG: hypothetical protein AMS24_03505 [Chlamydiae bacterium SM23_39]|nr:MAG: hypothetical protein AMS24_03505 [Chlamydiae bacterium SM23_39]
MRYSLVKNFKIIFFIFFIISPSFAFEPVILSEKKDFKKSRIYKNMSFFYKKKKILFCLSLPLEKKHNLSSIIVLAGLETGQENLKYIFDKGNYAFIGYEYPSILKKKKFSFSEILSLKRETEAIPSEILEITEWIKSQNWSNKKISICGFSFGAMFIPSIYHLSEKKTISLSPGIIAYGGADLFPIFYINFPGSSFTKFIKASLATLLFKKLKPSSHLPYLKNNFLIINGRNDPYIPFKQAQKLQKLTPYPKTIINLDTTHLSPKKTELLKTLNIICKEWLDPFLNQQQ